MIIVTTDFIPGYEITETLGVARIAIANLVAAAGIGIYLFHFRRRFEWRSAAQDLG